MSFEVRDWCREFHAGRRCPPSPVETGASNPGPTLVDVLERHPDWRRRLIAILRKIHRRG